MKPLSGWKSLLEAPWRWFTGSYYTLTASLLTGVSVSAIPIPNAQRWGTALLLVGSGSIGGGGERRGGEGAKPTTKRSYGAPSGSVKQALTA
jgi:hypothetical protein